jgi:hypothetical protein
MAQSVTYVVYWYLTYAQPRGRVEGLDVVNHSGDPETWGKTGNPRNS